MGLNLSSTNERKTDEWKNFEERINDQKLMWSPKEKMEFTRQWVSYRGQTLARTGLNSEGFWCFIYLLHLWMLTRPSCNRVCVHAYVCTHNSLCFFSSERDDVLQASPRTSVLIRICRR
jgi:hypothetical protein